MQKSFKVQIGDRIKDVRGELTQEQFAKVLGVKQNYVCRYEKGRVPSPDLLLKIANYGKVSVDWILTGRLRKAAGEVHETSAGYGKSSVDREIQDLLSRLDAKHKKTLLKTLKGWVRRRTR